MNKQMIVKEDMILDYLADGRTGKQICNLMQISPSNLSHTIQNIGKKLGIEGYVDRVKIKKAIMNWRIE